MSHSFFCRNTADTFFKIFFFVVITLSALSAQAMMVVKEQYLLTDIWPVRASFLRLDLPAGLAVDSRGYLYIADRGLNRILKLTPDGRLADQWGQPGIAPGQFDSPSGIATDSLRNLVYVADTGNDRIQIFTRHGDFVDEWHQWSAPETDAPETDFTPLTFNQPQGAAVDSRGFVYIADTGNDRILKFTPHGALVTQWGGNGSGPGQFINPQGIMIHGDTVYVGDTGNFRVQQFTLNGQYVTQWGGSKRFQAPAGITFGPDGRIYVTDKANIENPLMKFTLQGHVVYTDQLGNELAMPDMQPDESLAIWSPADAGLQNPEAIAAGPDGLIYVADTGNSRIVCLSADGRTVDAFPANGNTAGLFDAPAVITGDSHDNIFVGDQSTAGLLKFTAQGDLAGTPLNFNAFTDLSGAVMDADENFYIADGNSILKFDDNGNPVQGWTSIEFDSPRGLAIDANGFIYVADSGNDRICKLDHNGALTTEWGELNRPSDIAIAGDLVFVTDSGNRSIRVFNTDGGIERQWNNFDDPLKYFQDPQGIAADTAGNIYVADAGAGRVYKFNKWGTLLAEIGGPGDSAGGFVQPADVYVDRQGRIFVADTVKQNVQVFQNQAIQPPECGPQKAIIVAGSRPDDLLWENTQMCANLAYNALLLQGFTADAIRYLSANTDLDITNDGLPDVKDEASSSTLEAALQWAGKDTDSVVIYMVDHGGDGRFRLSGNEILDAATLDGWLDDLQKDANNPIPAAIVLDACRAASFMDTLKPSEGQTRLFIASAGADQDAGFAGYAALSFSNYFWSDIMMGKTVVHAFETAKSAVSTIYSYQTPVMSPNDGGGSFCLGNRIESDDPPPEIGSVKTEPDALNGTSEAAIAAEGVTDANGQIQRVWAHISPPRVDTQAYNPVLNLPHVDLLATDTAGQYRANWKRFSLSGEYSITAFATNNAGQISQPKTCKLTVTNPVSSKAILVAGSAGDNADLKSAIEANIRTAYDALTFQGYRKGDIYVISESDVVKEYDEPLPSLENVEAAIRLAALNTQDVLLYMTGKGAVSQFILSEADVLQADVLNKWLDEYLNDISGIVTVVYDACYSESFLAALSDNERIVISSAPAERCALMEVEDDSASDCLNQGGEHSFSAYFWKGVKNGLSVGRAFNQARLAVETVTSLLLGGLIEPQLDDTGNGVGNEPEDGVLADSHYIGAGFELADDGPVISDVSDSQTLTDTYSATLWAEVTATAGVAEVWAVITPPDYQIAADAAAIMDLDTVKLTRQGETNRYEGIYENFNVFGIYGITIHARDLNCKVSLPASTRVNQTQNAGNCLKSIEIGDQVHSFWSADCPHPDGGYVWEYTFNIDDDQSVSINLDSNAENTLLYLLDQDGNIIGPLNGDPQQIIESLGTGQYTIKVITTDASLPDYKLEVKLADPLPPEGTLRVNIIPEEALTDGAQWRIDGEEWRDSGSVHTSLAMGSHKVMFKTLPGWVRPDAQDIVITQDDSVQITGEYRSATEIFAAAYGGEDDETMTASALINDGSLIATGYVDTSGPGGTDLWIVKLNQTGQVKKQFTYGRAGVDKGWSADATSDGGAVIAGVTQSVNGDKDIIVIKLDKDANVLWKKTYGNTLNQDHPSIRSTDDGGFIMAAETETNDANGIGINTWVVKLDHAGLIKLEDVLDYGYYGGPPGAIKNPVVAVTNDSYTVVASSAGNFFLNEFDIAEGFSGYFHILGDVVLTSDGDESEPRIVRSGNGIMLVGTTHSQGPGIINIWLTKLDHNGHILWKKSVGEPETIHNLANLCTTADGGWMIAANRTGSSDGGDLSLFKLDANGTIEWQQAYSHEESGVLEACSVHQTAEGHYLVAGNRYQGQKDYFVFKMEETGGLPGCTIELQANLQHEDDPSFEIPPWHPMIVHDKLNVTPVSDHFTVMAWIKVFNFKARNVVFWSQDERPGMEVTDNQIRFAFKPNVGAGPLEDEPTGFFSSQTIQTGEWTHVACTWDGLKYKGYINGDWAGEIELPYFDLGGQIRIGQDDGPKSGNDPSLRNFDGLIDEVRIYAEALSEDQIKKAMDSNCKLSDSGAWIRNMTETVYEDAEDGSKDRWSVYDDQEPQGATFANLYDEERQSRVIEVHGAGATNPAQDGFKLYDFENTDQFIAQWSMKLIETPHTIYWDVETKDGNRWFIDYRADRPKECIVNPHDNQYITCGLGTEIKDGQWHTIVRDLRADLKYADPDNELLKVKSFRIRGHARVDDIKLRSVWPAGEDPTFNDDNCTAEHGGAVDFTAATGDLKGDFRFEGNLQEQVNSLEGSQPEGSVDFISSHDGRGIELDGSSYADYGDLPGTEFTGKEAFTVSMWVQDGARGVALSRYRYYFGFTDANISFRFKKQDTGSAKDQDPYHLNVPYPDNWKSGQWNHVTFVHFIKGQDDWQTVDRLIYVNGRLAGGTPEFYGYYTHTFTSDVELRSLKIGKTEHQGGMYFTGGLDEVRIFRRALTPCEIEVLSSGLKGHWRFDEPRGYKAQDSSGNGNHGANVGTEHCAGLYDQALNFTDDGPRDDRIIYLGNMDDYTLGHFTIMAWIKASQLKPGSYIWHSDNDRPSIKIADNGGVKFCFKPSTADEPLSGQENCIVSNPISIEQWVHLACSWDGAIYSGYINGRQVGVRDLPFFQLGGKVHIGDDNIDDALNFMGLIDDVRIYNRAMTSSEIAVFVPEINPEADLELTAITPQHGAADGSDTVTITGKGFNTVESVTFGGLAAEITEVSDTQITCKTPAHPVESVNVVITLADGQSVGRPRGYIYTGMAAHWRFDNNYKDEVSGAAGTKYGAPNDDFAFWEGHNGSAAAFDGTDDYVDYGDLPNTDFTGENPFSVSMWVKDGSEGQMMSRWRYVFLIEDNNIIFYFKKSEYEQDPYSLETTVPSNWKQDDWNHLAFVYGGEDGQRAIYVNSELVGSINHPTFNSSYELKSLKIGKTDHLGGHYFAGLLDDVQIYNRALSPCEIELMNTPPAGRWPFDEADGNEALDATGRGNHGKIIGTAREPGQTGFGGALDFGVDNDPDNHKDRVVLPRTMQYYISANMHAEDTDESPNFYCSPYDGENQIAAAPPPHVISSGTADKLWVDVDFEGDSQNVKVWAEVTAPNGETFKINADRFVYNPETGLWESDITNLNLYGEYEITFYAQIGEDTLKPETTAIFQDSQPDTYEDDNTCKDANDIQRHEIQHHNFHSQEDQDWVKFDGTEGEIYRIEVTDADVLCDAVIEVYNDHCELLASYDQGWAGDDEIYEFDKTTYNGSYYVKICQYDASVYGAFTGYDLRVYAPTGYAAAIFTGDVKNDGGVIKNANVTVDVNSRIKNCSTNDRGEYGLNFDIPVDGLMVSITYNHRISKECYKLAPNQSTAASSFVKDNYVKEIKRYWEMDPTWSLTLNITPNDIGAQWKIKGTDDWLENGKTVEGLSGPCNDVEFRADNSECWQIAEKQLCVTGCGETKPVAFDPKTQNLTVNIIPDTTNADARWFLDGKDTAYQSGQSVAVTYCEEHTISFNDIQGWRAPSPITVNLKDAGQANPISAEYISLLDPFAAAYGGYRNEKILASDAASDGGHIFAGWSDSFGDNDTDIWIIKLDKRGEIQWQRTLGLPKVDEFGYSVQQIVDGGYIVAGVRSSSISGNDDLIVFKLNSEGLLSPDDTSTWMRKYDANDELGAPVIRQTGNYYILAAEIGAVNAKDIVLMRLDKDGGVIRQQRFDGNGSETDPSIDLTEDGHVVVACTTQKPEGNRDILVFKVSATDGLKTDGWTYTFDGGRDDFTPKIRTTSDGCMVAATTKSFGTGEPHILLIKLNKEGVIQENWPKTIGQAGESHTLADIYTDAYGGCMIAGNRQTSTFEHALTLFKVANDGAEPLSKVYNPDVYNTEARAVHETIDGRITVSGFVAMDDHSDFLVLVTDQTGSAPDCSLDDMVVSLTTDLTLTPIQLNLSDNSLDVVSGGLTYLSEETEVPAHFLCKPSGKGPQITAVSECQTLACDGSMTEVPVWAEVSCNECEIEKVWAVIRPPGDLAPTASIPMPFNSKSQRFEWSLYEPYQFTSFGRYDIIIYATDTEGNTAMPETTCINQPAGPDEYEDDNEWENAAYYLPGADAQTHNFNLSDKVDWVKFMACYGLYEIEIADISADTQIEVNVYSYPSDDQPDQPVLLETVNSDGNNEIHIRLCSRDRQWYFLEIKNRNAESLVCGTGYTVQIEYMHELGDINGDMNVDLADAIIGLRVMAGFAPDIRSDYQNSCTDVDQIETATQHIDMGEVIYIMEKNAGMRKCWESY